MKEVERLYGDKFATVGSLKTGIFCSFDQIYVDYRKLDNDAVNYVTIGWLRFQVFPNNRILLFCEQVFHVCILCRLALEPSDRWALIHIKSSKLVGAYNYIGLFGVTGINQTERKLVNKYIAEYLYKTYLKAVNTEVV